MGTDDDDTYSATRLDFVTSKLSTLMFAKLRPRSDIASDCQGAIKLRNAKFGRHPKGIQGYITAQNAHHSLRERTEAFWVKSRPELNKNKSGRWSVNDFGIWLADGIAGKEMAKGIYKGKTISSLTVIDGDRLIKDMVSRDPNRRHITTLEGESILLDPIKRWCSGDASTNTV